MVIAIVALIFVGPKRLPEVMKQAGKLFVHVRRTANDVKGTFDQVVKEAEDDIRRTESDEMRQLMTGAKPATTVKAIESGVMDGSQAMAAHPTTDHPVADHPLADHPLADHPLDHPATSVAQVEHPTAAHPAPAEPPKDS